MWTKPLYARLHVAFLVFSVGTLEPAANIYAAQATATRTLTDVFAGQDQQFAEAFQFKRSRNGSGRKRSQARYSPWAGTANFWC